MIPTADSNGFLFRQTRVSSDILAVDSSKKPVASFKLVIDRNLTRNGLVRFFLVCRIYRNYYIDFDFFRVVDNLANANLRVDVNEQATESPGWRAHSTFNSNFTTECSNGTRTFLSVPVTAYVMNVTGEFHLSLWALTVEPWTGNQCASVGIDTQTVDSGNNLPPVLLSTLKVLFLHVGCSGDHLSYLFSTGECVETCPCGTSSWFGSCQKCK